jgi:hypothetical protein
MGATGQTFGGGPIIGVASTSKKESFHVFDTDKNHYDQWMFVYDPQLDRGGLIKGPYDGPPKFGQMQQMQGLQPIQGLQSTPGVGAPGTVSPGTGSPGIGTPGIGPNR